MVDLGEGSDQVAQSSVQPDGSVLAISQHFDGANYTFYLVRYSASGELDTSFGVGGRVAIPWTLAPFMYRGDNWAQHRVLFTQPGTGTILVAALGAAFACTPKGQPAVGFGAAGVLTPPAQVEGRLCRITRIEMAPDGSLVATGSTDEAGSNWDVVVLRYGADGILDPAFAGDGILVRDLINRSHDVAMAVMVDHAGRTLIGGNVETDGFLLRLLPDGAPDADFGTNGLLVPGTPSDLGTMIEMADGRVMCGRSCRADLINILRLNADGSIDSNYSNVGFMSPSGSYAILADGTVVAASTVNDGYPTYSDFVLRRFTPLGLPDEAFAAGGNVTIDFGASDDAGTAIFRPDGRIIVGGSAYVAGTAANPVLPRRAPWSGLRPQGHPLPVARRSSYWSCGGAQVPLVRARQAAPGTGRASWKTSAALKCNGTPVGAAELELAQEREREKVDDGLLQGHG